jgi:hypothetical protein
MRQIPETSSLSRCHPSRCCTIKATKTSHILVGFAFNSVFRSCWILSSVFKTVTAPDTWFQGSHGWIDQGLVEYDGYIILATHQHKKWGGGKL